MRGSHRNDYVRYTDGCACYATHDDDCTAYYNGGSHYPDSSADVYE